MKTREEVLLHLSLNGYTNDAIGRICGFLVARELKTLNEVIKYKKGDKSFEDFYRWYYDSDVKKDECCNGGEVESNSDSIEYCPICVLNTLIEDTIERLEMCATLPCMYDLVDRYDKQLAFLYDITIEQCNEEEDED